MPGDTITYHMLQKYTTYRVLQVFFNFPTRHFQLREISRLLDLGMPSVKSHIKTLHDNGFVKKEKHGVYESYVSSRSDLFKIYKRNDIVARVYECGLVEFLADKFVPDAIVLFGSASRGEDIETSDIDLLVVAREKDADLRKFEKSLGRAVSLHFEPNVSKIPKELLNNIANGIVLYGYLKVLA